jgi:hypothetical protein
MKRLVQIILLLAISSGVFAQTTEIGLIGGCSYYLGDLNPGVPYILSKPAYGVVARYNYGTRWAFRIGGYRGKVSGDDAISKANIVRGLRFESKITEISAVAEFNFYDFFIGTKKDNISPYIFAGVGFFMFNPMMDGTSLRDVGTEGQTVGFNGRKQYDLYSFCLPFGIGVKYSLSSRFGISLEWGMRKTLTDYIDDVSTTYYLDGSQINPANTPEVLSDPTFAHKANMERGNPTTNDWYNFTVLSVTYKFYMFGRRRCPDQGRSYTRL